MTSIPDYCRKILNINLRLIMQLLIQPYHFMSNAENLNRSPSAFLGSFFALTSMMEKDISDNSRGRKTGN